MTKIIAIDFDNTLAKTEFPNIIKPNHKLIHVLKQHQNTGDKLILWTCRNGINLKNALDFCKKQNLTFDAVNQNLPENIVKFGGIDNRKIFADIYIDDHSVLPENFK